jgi:hypothetical protein
MRTYDHVVDGEQNLRPSTNRIESDDYLMYRAVAGRTDVLDMAGLLGLQRTVAALVQRCGSTPCACPPDEKQAAQSTLSMTGGASIQRREVWKPDEVEEGGYNPRPSTSGEASADLTLHDRGKLTPQSIIALQRLAGNAAVTAALHSPARRRGFVVQRDEKSEEAKKSGPCKAPSLANTFKPSDTWGGKVWDVKLSDDEFGKTSKLAARFDLGACKDKDGWHFYVKNLEVMITSKIQPADFRINVSNASDSIVTKDEVSKIIRDLSPDRTVTFHPSCGSDAFDDKVTTYSLRRKYWNAKLVENHEAFHRKDWEATYRAELAKAEERVWSHKIPLKDAANEEDALAKARKDLEKFMIDAYQEACKVYSPKQESHAYDDGAPQYQKLVDEIKGRAMKEKWITK